MGERLREDWPASGDELYITICSRWIARSSGLAADLAIRREQL